MAQTSSHSRGYESNLSDLKDKGTEQINRMADKASEQFSAAADKASAMASTVAEQGREAGERVQEVAGNARKALDRSLKDQPMTTLAVAAAAGFVLGALWKS